MRKRSVAGLLVMLMVAGVAIGVGIVLYRSARVGKVSWDFVSNLRYQMATGENIAETPAGDALAVSYLETIFGDNQELLGRLKGVVQRGLDDDDALQLGEVSAMVVTYSRDESGKVDDVVAHVIGAFPRGNRKPGFNRDGYFRHLIDKNIWNLGNAVIGLLGRDMIMFAEEDVAQAQQDMLDALFRRGDVMPLTQRVSQSIYYTAVFPDPKKLMPLQLRHHVQAVVVKGFLSPQEGRWEVVLLSPSSRSASYVLAVLSDMKTVGEVLLRSKWSGIQEITPWGGEWVDTWWSYEMVQASESTTVLKAQNMVRMKVTFGRVMVNASLKSLERMGRDLAQSSKWQEGMDPRLVDQSLRSRSPQHYWSETHHWGPNWPFAAPIDTNATVETQARVTGVESGAATATP